MIESESKCISAHRPVLVKGDTGSEYEEESSSWTVLMVTPHI
jgi:hypothetical protein